MAHPAVYENGLRVASESNLDKRCVGADVLWIGSTSAILGCQHGVRIIHKLDNLVTEPTTSVPVDDR